MKNVALIIYSLKGGGAERVASTLSKELAKKYNLFFVVFDSDDMAYSFGGKLIDLDLKTKRTFLGKTLNMLFRSYKLRKIKKIHDIDCSISFMESANLPNVLSGMKSETTIVSFHSSNISKRLLDPSSRADWIVAVSQGVSNKLTQECGMSVSKMRTIYNPIDIPYLETCMAQESNGQANINPGFVIATMGRLNEAKGQWHLIRALTRVKIDIPDIKLLIFGDGELREYLSRLVEQLNLKSNVMFLGHQLNPFKYLRRADLFVLSSLYEGFPMVLCEAMACGLPVISTDCKFGPREIIAPNTHIHGVLDKIEYAEYGVLIPTCDGTYYGAAHPLTCEEHLMADSILELYKNNSLREEYSQKSELRATQFDIGNIVKHWETLIDG